MPSSAVLEESSDSCTAVASDAGLVSQASSSSSFRAVKRSSFGSMHKLWHLSIWHGKYRSLVAAAAHLYLTPESTLPGSLCSGRPCTQPEKMPAYHSQFVPAPLIVANMAILPVRTQYKGPAPKETGDFDIIDEAFSFFKANIFFRNYEIKSEADRTLIYITLYITECLKKLQKVKTKNNGLKEMYTLALQQWSAPGDSSFPLNAMYQKPANKQEDDTMKAYLLQLRQEVGVRICDKVYEAGSDEPSKWWMCFTKRRFMDKALSSTGQYA